jgi:glycosyltransferase involved in cell wall biosynthesis
LARRALRVLHVVGGMPRAGTETWLMHLLRHVDRGVLAMDFLVHRTDPQAYDEEIRRRGASLIPCLGTFSYAWNFLSVLADYGPYDIVHSHVQHYGGVILTLAAAAKVPVRIAHSHNDTVTETSASGWLRRAYVSAMNALVRHYSTHGIAVSTRAAVALFGSRWKRDSRWRVMPCGLDLKPFQASYDRDAIRSEYGVPLNAFVVGHVGRFVEQKNHAFLVEIFAAVVRRQPQAVLVLVGEGPLRPDVERQAESLGLKDRVRFIGIREDVPKLMGALFDVLLFPSRWEGLGLVLVEAQAAGLRSVISDVVPHEADVVPGLIRRVSLESSAETWALEACVIGRSRARPATGNWGFSIESSAAGLLQLYSEAVARGNNGRAHGVAVS